MKTNSFVHSLIKVMVVVMMLTMMIGTAILTQLDGATHVPSPESRALSLLLALLSRTAHADTLGDGTGDILAKNPQGPVEINVQEPESVSPSNGSSDQAESDNQTARSAFDTFSYCILNGAKDAMIGLYGSGIVLNLLKYLRIGIAYALTLLKSGIALIPYGPTINKLLPDLATAAVDTDAARLALIQKVAAAEGLTDAAEVARFFKIFNIIEKTRPSTAVSIAAYAFVSGCVGGNLLFYLKIVSQMLGDFFLPVRQLFDPVGACTAMGGRYENIATRIGQTDYAGVCLMPIDGGGSSGKKHSSLDTSQDSNIALNSDGATGSSGGNDDDALISDALGLNDVNVSDANSGTTDSTNAPFSEDYA